MADGLQQQAAAGARWSALASALSAMLSFGQTALLARILLPEHFGTAALITTFVYFAALLRDFGLGTSLIQVKNLDPAEVSSVFWLQFLFGAAAYGTIWFGASLIAIYEPTSDLPALLIIAALSLPISALGSVPAALARRQLDFRSVSIVSIASAGTSTLVTVASAALFDQGVWSFVWGGLTNALTSTLFLLSYFRRRFRQPRIFFSLRHLLPHLRFGAFYFSSQMLGVIGSRTDQLIVGLLLGTEALGFYSVAASLVLLPWRTINPVLTGIAMPVIARVKDDRERTLSAFLRMLSFLTQVNVPLLLGLAAVAPTLVPLYLGPDWQPVVGLVQVLSIYALARTLGNAGSPLVLAFGASRPLFNWSLFVFWSHPLLLAAASLSGSIVVVAAALSLSQPLYIWGQYQRLLKPLTGPFGKRYLRTIAPAITAGLLMAAAGIVATSSTTWTLPDDTLISLIAQVSLGVGIYLILLTLIDGKQAVANLRLAIRRSAVPPTTFARMVIL
jgi:lipopolysaccharide exporter